MRNGNPFYLLFCLAILFIGVPSFAQDDYAPYSDNMNKGVCTEDGDCLLCYLTLDVESEAVTDLISKYNLKYEEVFYQEWKNANFSLLVGRGKVWGISIWPEKFNGQIPYGVESGDSRADLEAKFGPSEVSTNECTICEYVKTFDNFYRMTVFFADDLTSMWNIRYSIISGVELTPNCLTSGIESELSSNSAIIEAVDFNTKLSKIILSAQEDFNGADHIMLEGVYGKKMGSTLQFAFNVRTESFDEAHDEFEIIRKKIDNLWVGSFGTKVDLEYADDNEVEQWYINLVRLDELETELYKVKIMLEMMNHLDDGSIGVQLNFWKE
jgi:hypothetical protein